MTSTETYKYDPLSRLVSAKGLWGTITYTYDPAGNRKSMILGSSKTYYTYGWNDELAVAGSSQVY